MQGPSLDDFPNGSFFKKKERTTIQVDSQTIYLTKVIKEEYCGRGETYKVLFEGEIIPEGYNCQEDPDLDLGLGRSVIVKFIYQMHPQYHNENYLPTLYNIEKGFFLSECRALHSLGDSGYVPKYVTHAEGKQGEDGPYPGGFLFVLVRSRLEGTFIRRSEERRRAPFSLSAEEMQYIKGEIVKAHELFRQNGWSFGFGLEDAFYNKEKRHLFFIGFRLCEGSPSSPAFKVPLTEKSGYLSHFWDSMPKSIWEGGMAVEDSDYYEQGQDGSWFY